MEVNNTLPEQEPLWNMATANALQLEAARITPAVSGFNYAPCQVWSRWTNPLPYYSVYAANTLLYAVTLTSDPVTLTFNLWPWTFAVYHLWDSDCDVMKLCSKFEHNRAICGGVIAISVTLSLNIATRCARLCDNLHQVWPSTTYPCLNYSVAYTWYHAVTLTFDPLTLKVRGTSRITWSKSVHNLSVVRFTDCRSCHHHHLHLSSHMETCTYTDNSL